MNLPNALTILRIFFVPLLVAALVQENVGFQIGAVKVTNEWLSLAIFLVGGGYRSAGRLPGAALEAGDHHRHAARSDRR